MIESVPSRFIRDGFLVETTKKGHNLFIISCSLPIVFWYGNAKIFLSEYLDNLEISMKGIIIC